MLKHRVMTAVVLLPIVLGLVFFAPTWLLAGVFGGVVLAGADELARLAGWKAAAPRWIMVSVAGLVLITGWLIFERGAEISVVLYAALVWLGVVIALLVTKPRMPGWLVYAGGLFMLGSCLAAVTALHANVNAGRSWLFLMLVLIWAADIGGYFSGKRFGKHRMAPRISPGKTWEGVAGGIAAAIAVAAVWAYMLQREFLPLIAIGLGIVVVSIIGDLFESYLKRQAGLKDSGSVLPGHGGILDRIDSLLITAPLYLLTLQTLGYV